MPRLFLHCSGRWSWTIAAVCAGKPPSTQAAQQDGATASNKTSRPSRGSQGSAPSSNRLQLPLDWKTSPRLLCRWFAPMSFGA
jgi:hypothetical protein